MNEIPEPENPFLIKEVQNKLSKTENINDGQVYLNQLVKLKDNAYYEPTCKICNSVYKEDIEKTYFRTKSLKAVHDFLKPFDVSFTDKEIEHHMIYHTDKNSSEMKKGEYLGDLSRLKNSKISTLDHIEDSINTVRIQMMNLQGLEVDAKHSIIELERLKSSELTKLTTSLDRLLKLQAEIKGEMKKSGNYIYIPKDQFVSIFNETLSLAKNPTEKKIINILIQKLNEVSTSG